MFLSKRSFGLIVVLQICALLSFANPAKADRASYAALINNQDTTVKRGVACYAFFEIMAKAYEGMAAKQVKEQHPQANDMAGQFFQVDLRRIFVKNIAEEFDQQALLAKGQKQADGLSVKELRAFHKGCSSFVGRLITKPEQKFIMNMGSAHEEAGPRRDHVLKTGSPNAPGTW